MVMIGALAGLIGTYEQVMKGAEYLFIVPSLTTRCSPANSVLEAISCALLCFVVACAVVSAIAQLVTLEQTSKMVFCLFLREQCARTKSKVPRDLSGFHRQVLGGPGPLLMKKL